MSLLGKKTPNQNPFVGQVKGAALQENMSSRPRAKPSRAHAWVQGERVMLVTAVDVLPGSRGKAPDSTRSNFPASGWSALHFSHLYTDQEVQVHQLCFHRYSPETAASHTPSCSWSCCSGSVENSARKVSKPGGKGKKNHQTNWCLDHNILLGSSTHNCTAWYTALISLQPVQAI